MHFRRPTCQAIRGQPSVLASTKIGKGLARLSQLLTNHPPQRVLERRLLALHVLAQRLVDEALVVAATGPIHLVAKPSNEIGVQADRDAGLARAGGTAGPRFPLLKS